MKKAPYTPAVRPKAQHFGDPRLTFPVTYSGTTLLASLSTLHYIVEKQRAKNVILDFSKSRHVLESGMLPLIPIINKHVAKRNVAFQLILPKDERVASQFRKCNWAHLIDPLHYDYDENATITHCPALRFRNSEEQGQAVDKIIKVVLSSTGVDRDVLRAIEWSLNEITDNVMNHADAQAGYVQATWFRENNIIEFVVADAGVGIAASLRESDHALALERAIQEGVTRNKTTNQGNGLYGSYRIAQIGKGQFSIQSQYGYLNLKQNGEIKISNTKSPYAGTTVRWNIKTDVKGILAKALVFKGEPHEPAFDFIDKISSEGSRVSLPLKEMFPSLGSRDAGSTVQQYIRNILVLDSTSIIDCDFSDINIISSSFADEVFGKIFAEFGPMSFMRRVNLMNVEPDILRLIDRAIMLRSAQMGGA
ncbi:MAG: STAS-like domain-containing protein [Brevundimonas sp.]